MKKFATAFALLAVLSGAAFAADKIGDACPSTGHISQAGTGGVFGKTKP